MGKKKTGLPYSNAMGNATIGQPADHVRKPIKLPYAGTTPDVVENTVDVFARKQKGETIMTKVVKSIIVRRTSGDESYTVGEAIPVTIGEKDVPAKISHIDSINRKDNNGLTHTYYDVYAKTSDGENAFHVVTVQDVPVEVKYGYRPF